MLNTVAPMLFGPIKGYDGLLIVGKRFSVSSQVVVIRFAEMGWIEGALKNRLRNDSRLVIRAKGKFDPEINRDPSRGCTQCVSDSNKHFFIYTGNPKKYIYISWMTNEFQFASGSYSVNNNA